MALAGKVGRAVRWIAEAEAEHTVTGLLAKAGKFIWGTIGDAGKKRVGEIVTNQIQRKFSEEHRHEVMGLILTLSDTIVGFDHEEWVKVDPARGSSARTVILERLKKTLATHGKENQVLMLLSKDWNEHENDPIDTTMLSPELKVDSPEFVELKKFINSHRYKLHLILLAELQEEKWDQYLEHLKHDPIVQGWKKVDEHLEGVAKKMRAARLAQENTIEHLLDEKLKSERLKKQRKRSAKNRKRKARREWLRKVAMRTSFFAQKVAAKVTSSSRKILSNTKNLVRRMWS